MKKTLLFIFASVLFMGLNAQNLVTNAGLEEWTDDVTPVGWTKAENISKSDAMVHSGTYSAMQTSADGTQDFQQDIAGITGGVEYTISYWYYDNDAAARTRIWSYWMDAEGTYLDDNEDILRPSNTYSEDNAAWQQFNVSLVAPANAAQFRFEVRVYKQDGATGGMVYYDDFTLEGGSLLPEPTNYPTNFAAMANGLNIDLSWTDATGEQLPSAYLILAAAPGAELPNVEDGTPIADDTDLSDGVGALNITQGTQMAAFTDLEAATTYHFEIYPYTNGGENINYKNDGMAPEATATTSDVEVLSFTDFNDMTWGDWTIYDVTGDLGWSISDKFGIDDSPCAKATGYAGAAEINEDWLISAPFNASSKASLSLEFYTAKNYNGPDLQLMVSEDYDGASDPNGFEWTEVAFTPSAGSWEWTFGGTLDLSGFSSEELYIAFLFTSTDSESATWELDNIKVLGSGTISVEEMNEAGLSVYPNPASDILNIKSENAQEINIYNIAGQKVMSALTNSGTTSISVENLEAGIYMIESIDTNTAKRATSKLIVR